MTPHLTPASLPDVAALALDAGERPVMPADDDGAQDFAASMDAAKAIESLKSVPGIATLAPDPPDEAFDAADALAQQGDITGQDVPLTLPPISDMHQKSVEDTAAEALDRILSSWSGVTSALGAPMPRLAQAPDQVACQALHPEVILPSDMPQARQVGNGDIDTHRQMIAPSSLLPMIMRTVPILPHESANPEAFLAPDPRIRADPIMDLSNLAALPVILRMEGTGFPVNDWMPHRAATPNPQAVVQQVADAVVTMRDDRVEIVLKPEELGRIRVVVSGADTAVPQIVVWADRPEILDQLRRHAALLGQHLGQAGMTDTMMEFRQGDGRDDQAQPTPQPRDFRRTDDDETAFAGPAIAHAMIASASGLTRLDIRL